MTPPGKITIPVYTSVGTWYPMRGFQKDKIVWSCHVGAPAGLQGSTCHRWGLLQECWPGGALTLGQDGSKNQRETMNVGLFPFILKFSLFLPHRWKESLWIWHLEGSWGGVHREVKGRIRAKAAPTPPALKAGPCAQQVSRGQGLQVKHPGWRTVTHVVSEDRPAEALSLLGTPVPTLASFSALRMNGIWYFRLGCYCKFLLWTPHSAPNTRMRRNTRGNLNRYIENKHLCGLEMKQKPKAVMGAETTGLLTSRSEAGKGMGSFSWCRKMDWKWPEQRSGRDAGLVARRLQLRTPDPRGCPALATSWEVLDLSRSHHLLLLYSGKGACVSQANASSGTQKQQRRPW